MNVLVVLAFCLSIVESYKFLVLMPLPIRSLNLLGEAITRHLLNAGHEVTFITCFPKDNTDPKLRQIDISENYILYEGDDSMNIGYIIEHGLPQNDDFYLQDVSAEGARMTFQNKHVQALLNDTSQHFDAVIIDWVESEIYAGLASVFNTHLIWSYSLGPHWQVLRLIDEASNPAYNSNAMSPNVPPLGFLQRFQELYNQIKREYVRRFKIVSKEQEIYDTYLRPAAELRGRTILDYQEAIYSAALMVSNSHHAIGGWPKTPQNFKFVAGYHIHDNPKPLPEDLQKVMDSSPHGVIYFSMGSLWHSQDIPTHVTESLIRIFGSLKQTVIWKYEGDLPNKPKNLYTVKWAPQVSILAHPKLLFFISHGGLLSQTEAIHHGVPLIGIPIYYDQYYNVNRAVTAGFGLQVDLNLDLPKKLQKAIQEMLRNPKYKESAKDLSMKYHDRPVKPGVELVHWIEHVVKTNGAPHLRSPALAVPAYQKLFLDLIALVLLVVIIIVRLLKKTFRNIVKKHEKFE